MAKIKRIITTLVRLLVLGAALSATIVMVTSHDSAEVLNLSFDAKYTNARAFVYFAITNAIASGYSFIALFLSFSTPLWHLVFLLDVFMTLLLTSSISVALAIADVGKKGNSHAGWLPVCGQVPEFCDHVTGALIAGFSAAVLYLVLLLFSIHAVLNPKP
uniref:CASP-like protein 1C1 n=2 Tax=Vitis vinifera TaxID=29760 RepID=CSPLB_VITVI|nr:RecName: Full=CASP-like protein 1C1; Short=VvCASPL1C1 [Vitis vinifera]